MQVRYGSYSHDADECFVAISREPLQNEAQLTYGHTETWEIQGFKQASTFADLTSKLAALELAYAVDYQPIGLFDNNGNPSQHGLPGRTAIGGTRIVRQVSYPEGKGAEYAAASSYRSYTVAVACDVVYAGISPVLLLSWGETVSFVGGGPRYVWLEPRNGLPQRQLVSQATTQRVTQKGEAIALAGYPVPAGPIFPALEHLPAREVDWHPPERRGDTYRRFRVSWSYTFESAVGLSALPNLWPY